MQKTEKHCKNQCFCYHKTTKISPKTGPKTQKSASGPGHLRNRKKRCCKPKNWGQKVEKHRVFSLFACRFWTGAFTNRCLPYCFLQCFLKASVTTYQKQEVLAEKCPPPPPGKPVTFYECHPDDHAPAPSVRADFSEGLKPPTSWWHLPVQAIPCFFLADKRPKPAAALRTTFHLKRMATKNDPAKCEIQVGFRNSTVFTTPLRFRNSTGHVVFHG